MSEEWKGEERRGLPLHILKYIDERMEEQYNAFSSRIDTLDDRMINLTNSISSWIDKEPAAIPNQRKEELGHIDYSQHNHWKNDKGPGGKLRELSSL
jgi:hypothetical protein